jgi:hypothetical protein
MQDFEVVTNFYTLVPWLTGSFIIFGIVAAIALSILLGWWVGAKSTVKKSNSMWFALGWIPIFGIFVGSIFAGSAIYYESRNNLSKTIQIQSDIHVITFVRGNDHVFVGTKDNELLICTLTGKASSETYIVNCP